jgi:hypothetical protein
MNDRILIEHTFHDSIRLIICMVLLMFIITIIEKYNVSRDLNQRTSTDVHLFISTLQRYYSNDTLPFRDIENMLYPFCYCVNYIGDYLLGYVLYCFIVHCAMHYYFVSFFTLKRKLPECIHLFLKLGMQIWYIE